MSHSPEEGYVGGKDEDFAEPASLAVAMAWIDGYKRVLRKAHVRLADGTTLWFEPHGFTNATVTEAVPTSGIVIRHPEPPPKG